LSSIFNFILAVALQYFHKKKDFGGNETESKAGQCKELIIYSISSPLGLCHVQVKKSSILVELEFGVFCGGRKSGEPREKPSEQGREPTTNSTHI